MITSSTRRPEDSERAIIALSAEDLAGLRAWIDDLDGRLLDQMIDRDAPSGRWRKLDALAARALADHRSGRSRAL